MTPLATPVPVNWCQCPPSGPEASWHSLATLLLLASLSFQNEFANFLLLVFPGPGWLLNLCLGECCLPWAIITPETTPTASLCWRSSVWTRSLVLFVPNKCQLALWFSKIFFPNTKDFFFPCLVGASFCESPCCLTVFRACVPLAHLQRHYVHVFTAIKKWQQSCRDMTEISHLK